MPPLLSTRWNAPVPVSVSVPVAPRLAKVEPGPVATVAVPFTPQVMLPVPASVTWAVPLSWPLELP